MGKYAAAVDDHLVIPARALLSQGQEQVLRLLGRTVPKGVGVRLIIDTGSKRTALVPWVLDQLSPPLMDNVRVETSTGDLHTGLFWVRLDFPDTGLSSIPAIAVARIPLPPSVQAFHGLLGRDLLRRMEYLFYQGRKQRLAIRDRPWWRF